MKEITLSALAFLVLTASAFTLRNENTAQTLSHNPELACNGAFRDGFYLGKLASENGGQYHIATARWANAEERVHFAAGYEQGYKSDVAIRAAR